VSPVPPGAWQTYRRLLAYARPYRLFLGAAAIGMVLEASSAGLFARLMEPMVNETFVARDPAVRWSLPLAILGLFVLRGTATFVTDYGMARAGRSVVRDLRTALLAKFLRLPSARFDREPVAAMVSPTRSVKVAPPSVEASRRSRARWVAERRVWNTAESGELPVKSRRGVAACCATVALVERSAFGALRGEEALVVKSSVPGVRSRLEVQPAGSAGGTAASNDSANGGRTCWAPRGSGSRSAAASAADSVRMDRGNSPEGGAGRQDEVPFGGECSASGPEVQAGVAFQGGVRYRGAF